MRRTVYFIWLNDTTLQRHYWQHDAGGYQGWSTDFALATKFDSQQAAEAILPKAYKTTLAECVIQPYLID